MARRNSSPPDPLIGALLRVPAHAIHRRLIAELNTAGFDDLRAPHIAVLQYPGPDGARPGTLAARSGMSKQAMNQLLRSLEALGYLERSDHPEEGRARIVRLTKRGRSVMAKMREIVSTIEAEWRTELGSREFDHLKSLLQRIWSSSLVRDSDATESDDSE
jgi:DNA-binding MarR family transcriptional regulator